MIHLYSFVLFVYVAVRLIVPLPTGAPVKVCTTLIVLLVSLKHWFFKNVSGGLAAPDLPRFFIILSGWLYATLVFLFLFLLLRDIIASLFWAASRFGIFTDISVTGKQATLGLIALSVACSSWGLFEAIRLPAVKKEEVTLAHLPKELDGLTIVQVSDLHANAFHPEEKVRKIVETINALQPDLVLLTGDIVDGSTAKREADVAPLKELNAKYGVFGSVGNHEYYSGFDAWQKKFPELGIRILNNSHVTLKIGGKELVLAGITDPVAAQFRKAVPNVSESLEGAPENAVRILMAHRPQDAEIHAKAGVDLQFSGHTHGGQIIGLNRFVARFNENRLMGWYKIDGMKLYISTGISLWNGFPVRFGVPSEIPFFVLKSSQKP